MQKINFLSITFTDPVLQVEQRYYLSYTCCWYTRILYWDEKSSLVARLSFIPAQLCSSFIYKISEELYVVGGGASGEALFFFFHSSGLKAADSNFWHELALGGSISVACTPPPHTSHISKLGLHTRLPSASLCFRTFLLKQNTTLIKGFLCMLKWDNRFI
jgi:hypothetical protein